MRNALSIILLCGLLLASGCSKECKTGYTGADCKTELVKSYFGGYNGAMTNRNSSWHQYYEVGTMSSSATEISIGGFRAVLENNTGKFYLPSQPGSYNGATGTAYGTAYFSDGRLDMNITISVNGTNNDFFFTGIKTQ